jgi:hypothetical protein
MKTRNIIGIMLITVLMLALLGPTQVSAKDSRGDGDNQQNKGKQSNDQGDQDQDQDKDRPCGDKIPIGWYDDGNPWD